MTIDSAYPLYGASGFPELDDLKDFRADRNDLDDLAEHAAMGVMVQSEPHFVRADIFPRSDTAYEVVLWHEVAGTNGLASHVKRDVVEVNAADIEAAWARHPGNRPDAHHQANWPAVYDAADYLWNKQHPNARVPNAQASRTETAMLTLTGSREAKELHGSTPQVATQIAAALKADLPVTMSGTTEKGVFDSYSVINIKTRDNKSTLRIFDPAAKNPAMTERNVRLETAIQKYGGAFEVHQRPVSPTFSNDRSGEEPLTRPLPDMKLN